LRRGTFCKNAQASKETKMSKRTDCKLDVLTDCQEEMNRVAERLNRPSQELASWVAQVFSEPASEVAEHLKELLEFKNFGRSRNSADRRFSIAFEDTGYEIVWRHLLEVSGAFPKAVFLVEYRDNEANYASKTVMRAGEVVQELFDDERPDQLGVDWALLDIFAPFRTEYYGGGTFEFGSLWQPWLDAMIAAARQLKDDETPARQEATEATAQEG
jgi:hypothetical protein